MNHLCKEKKKLRICLERKAVLSFLFARSRVEFRRIIMRNMNDTVHQLVMDTILLLL